MSLRDGILPSKQSLNRGDCFAAARNDMCAKVNALQRLQSAAGEELSALLPSILDKAFKGEL